MKPSLQVIYYFLDEVGRMSRYLRFSEMLLEQEHQSYLKSLESDDESDSERYRHRRDLGADFGQLFPQYHRRSSLLVFFGMFEENCNHLCYSLKEEKALQLSLRDLSDKGIDRSRTYLTKVVGWTLPETQDWRNLKEIQTIRNWIAHSSGYLPEPIPEATALIIGNNDQLSIEIGARKRLSFGHGYLEYVLSNVESYWRTLEEVCRSADMRRTKKNSFL